MASPHRLKPRVATALGHERAHSGDPREVYHAAVGTHLMFLPKASPFNRPRPTEELLDFAGIAHTLRKPGSPMFSEVAAEEKAVEASLTLFLVRHGETYGNAHQAGGIAVSEERIARGDDELTSLGISQAQARGRDLEWAQTAATLDAVFVSPLRRALHTAILALSSDEVVAARQRARNFDPVVLLLEPDLRELNRFQTAGSAEGLYWRHRGTRLGQLRDEFAPLLSVLSDAVVVDWGSGGAAMEGGEVWWDHDEKRGLCTVDYADAHWRAHGFLEDLRECCAQAEWQRVALFGHEGCFRSMTGVATLGNAEVCPSARLCSFCHNYWIWFGSLIVSFCTLSILSRSQVLACRVVTPSVVALSPERRCDAHGVRARLTKAVPLALAKRVQRHDIRTLVAVLGCQDSREATRRMRRGIDTMRARGGCALVYLCAAGEFTHFLSMMHAETAPSVANAALGLTDDEKSRILADQCSATTACSVDHALALATALRPGLTRGRVLVLVTSAWHMPRAALCAADALARSGLAGEVACEYASHFMDALDDATSEHHLRDGAILSRRVVAAAGGVCGGRHAAAWVDTALGGRLGAELREVGDNMRRWHALNVAAEGGAFWSEGVKARKHVLVVAIKKLDRAVANEAMREAVEHAVGDADAVALALVPLDDDGNSVLHYCARHDATEIARDAIVFFGARLNARNKAGQTWSAYSTIAAMHAAVDAARALVSR